MVDASLFKRLAVGILLTTAGAASPLAASGQGDSTEAIVGATEGAGPAAAISAFREGPGASDSNEGCGNTQTVQGSGPGTYQAVRLEENYGAESDNYVGNASWVDGCGSGEGRDDAAWGSGVRQFGERGGYDIRETGGSNEINCVFWDDEISGIVERSSGWVSPRTSREGFLWRTRVTHGMTFQCGQDGIPPAPWNSCGHDIDPPCVTYLEGQASRETDSYENVQETVCIALNEVDAWDGIEDCNPPPACGGLGPEDYYICLSQHMGIFSVCGDRDGDGSASGADCIILVQGFCDENPDTCEPDICGSDADPCDPPDPCAGMSVEDCAVYAICEGQNPCYPQCDTPLATLREECGGSPPDACQTPLAQYLPDCGGSPPDPCEGQSSDDCAAAIVCATPGDPCNPPDPCDGELDDECVTSIVCALPGTNELPACGGTVPDPGEACGDYDQNGQAQPVDCVRLVLDLVNCGYTPDPGQGLCVIWDEGLAGACPGYYSDGTCTIGGESGDSTTPPHLCLDDATVAPVNDSQAATCIAMPQPELNLDATTQVQPEPEPVLAPQPHEGPEPAASDAEPDAGLALPEPDLALDDASTLTVSDDAWTGILT